MGKISKHSNLYNRHGGLLKKVNSDGILEEYTLKEVQDLVDKLGTEKDKNGNIKDQFGFNNASYVLMHMYNDPKYDKEKKNFIKELNDRLRVDEEGVKRTLEGTNKDLVQSEITETSAAIKPEDIQRVGEDWVDSRRETGNESIKYNLDEQEVTMSKSYDVNDNKEEYVEYKEN